MSTLITMLNGTQKHSYWQPSAVATAIKKKEPVTLIDGERLSPFAIATWEAGKAGMIEGVLEHRRKEAEFWRGIRENGPMRGSPAWIEQQPWITRWWHEIVTAPRS